MFIGIIGCGYFCSSRFPYKDVCDMTAKLVPVTRILWQMTKVKIEGIFALIVNIHLHWFYLCNTFRQNTICIIAK